MIAEDPPISSQEKVTILLPVIRLALNVCWSALAHYQTDIKSLLASTGPLSDSHLMFAGQHWPIIRLTLNDCWSALAIYQTDTKSLLVSFGQLAD